MTTEGSEVQRRRAVADVAAQLFDVPVAAANVIGETLARATTADATDPSAVARSVDAHRRGAELDHAGLVADPLARWVEDRFGVQSQADRLVRPPRPSTLPDAAVALSTATGRRDSDASGGEADDGYLFISSEVPWPASVDVALSEQRLPESWLVTEPDGRVTVAQRRRKHLPEPVHLDVDGCEVDPGQGTPAAYVAGPFAFCLCCRTSYERLRSSDFAKLSSLSVEGRSSATSVVSASVVRSLCAQPELGRDGRKLLAFADNRQDASLQAGHFNDFVQVTQLRGALYRALREAPDGLTHEVIEQRVTDALRLELSDVARNPDAPSGACSPSPSRPPSPARRVISSSPRPSAAGSGTGAAWRTGSASRSAPSEDPG